MYGCVFHCGFGRSVFAMSWGEGEARTCLVPRLDDSNVQISLGALFCGPTAALDKFPL